MRSSPPGIRLPDAVPPSAAEGCLLSVNAVQPSLQSRVWTLSSHDVDKGRRFKDNSPVSWTPAPRTRPVCVAVMKATISLTAGALRCDGCYYRRYFHSGRCVWFVAWWDSAADAASSLLIVSGGSEDAGWRSSSLPRIGCMSLAPFFTIFHQSLKNIWLFQCDPAVTLWFTRTYGARQGPGEEKKKSRWKSVLSVLQSLRTNYQSVLSVLQSVRTNYQTALSVLQSVWVVPLDRQTRGQLLVPEQRFLSKLIILSF